MLVSLIFSLPSLSSSFYSPSFITGSSSPNRNRNSEEAPRHDRLNRSSKDTRLPGRRNAPIKMPTAPWMRSPLLPQTSEVVNPSKHSKGSRSKSSEDSIDEALTRRESGVRGRKAMKKIIRNVERLREFQEAQRDTNIEEIELGDRLDRILGGNVELNDVGGKMPWDREEERIMLRRTKKEKVLTAAEMSLDKDLLYRLRREAARIRKWVKVKKAGVTQAVVDEIRSIWRNQELAMINFDLPLCRNMDRAQEIVEMKTGGLVVHRKKAFLAVYRGCRYHFIAEDKFKKNSAEETGEDGNNACHHSNFFGEGSQIGQPVHGSLYEREADRLLDRLGPRYVDWWMRKPLPVDGDLLPEVVPGFRAPQRRCPPQTRSKLTDYELTYLRKIAHSLPFHFVLGRNRGLRGLAAAILKLWERCLIAKIAVKWGAQNTNNEQMADELKRLTGGVLILRNKFLIILFRGKDFLSPVVAGMIVKRERALGKFQLHEEGERLKEIDTLEGAGEPLETCGNTGTLSEFQELQSKFLDQEKINRDFEVALEAEKERLEKELRKQERKLSIMKSKIEKSAAERDKLNSSWKPAERAADFEILTKEERECFRKIGLKMTSSLVLGRRGIFDGVIEGLHQHWKHREVAKVITMQRQLSRVLYTAKWLEAESGGVLVCVEKLKEGHAIIVYRGKNYRRPPELMTHNLLDKRKAMQRSLELQRIGSLKFYAYRREQEICDKRLRLVRVEASLLTQTILSESHHLETSAELGILFHCLMVRNNTLLQKGLDQRIKGCRNGP